jgi:hypothetical protein
VDLYGNREAIQHWNAFYRLMRRRGTGPQSSAGSVQPGWIVRLQLGCPATQSRWPVFMPTPPCWISEAGPVG